MRRLGAAQAFLAQGNQDLRLDGFAWFKLNDGRDRFAPFFRLARYHDTVEHGCMPLQNVSDLDGVLSSKWGKK
nr:hypothetical protein [Afipia sp. GAS231]